MRNVFFVSFDLSGATQFKNDLALWGGCIYHFYRIAEEIIKKRAVTFKVFKYLGDEIILWRRIRRKKDIHDCLLECRKLYNEIKSSVSTNLKHSKIIEVFFKKRGDAKQLIEISLGVKATCWLSACKEITKFRETIDAEGFDLYIGEIDDVIGPQMDTGFRLAKHAIADRLLLSIDLASIATEWGNEFSVSCEGYQELKGISTGKPYPLLCLPTNTEKQEVFSLQVETDRIYTPYQKAVLNHWKEMK